jgi:hypothetical protein
MWGYIGDSSDEDFSIGEVSGGKTCPFPHSHFYQNHGNDQIVAAKGTMENDRRVDITSVDEEM